MVKQGRPCIRLGKLTHAQIHQRIRQLKKMIEQLEKLDMEGRY
jgi:hypothetical protein